MTERVGESGTGDQGEIDQGDTDASPFRAAFKADETPALKGYRVEEILGSGGHSTVYLATVGAERQAGLEPGTRVAIKHWRDAANESSTRARLEREVEVLRGLEHPHLVRFLGLTEDAAGAPAIVMEAVRGPNLAELIATEGPLAPERAQAIGAALCLALEHLAGQGLVHRDVKPANVILRRADDQPVLVDFSVTKRLSPELASAQLTSTGAALGTSAYMAPEQCAGDLGAIDARTDLYGVGALLFQALTGLPPWTHESGWERTQRNPWSQPYPAQPELRARVEAAQARVPTNLGAVVARCLEGDPAARFPDASALRRALLDPSPPPRGAPRTALAIVLGLCCLMTYGFFNQASWLSPNHGQTPKEEPMKTASLAAIATLTPLLAFAGEPTPAPTPGTAPSSIGESLAKSLASGDEAAFAAILRPKRAGAREKAIRRFHALRGRLVKAGISPRELTFQAAIVHSNGGDPAAQPAGTTSNLLVQFGVGARRLWLLLDDCKLEEGRWWLTDKAATRWLESPQPTKEEGGLISRETALGLQSDLLVRDDAAVTLSSTLGDSLQILPEGETWASQLPPVSPGNTASSTTVFTFHEDQARSCGQFVTRYTSAAAADYAFATLVQRAREGRRREAKNDWTLSYVARARNVVAYVLEQDEGRALPTRSAWLERWIQERLAKCSSQAEVVEFRPRESDSIGALLLRAFREGEVEEFTKILRPKKLSYAVRARETFRDLHQRLVATGLT